MSNTNCFSSNINKTNFYINKNEKLSIPKETFKKIKLLEINSGTLTSR
ncbi:hypothetical protein [Paraclostridium sordellii]|nr:hypothetical protein [Paeniclostridium sordellii]CEO20616.1 Uncharacterised protein [[Clostridium] sordellii] [Paeniclostridium sordellii]